MSSFYTYKDEHIEEGKHVDNAVVLDNCACNKVTRDIEKNCLDKLINILMKH